MTVFAIGTGGFFGAIFRYLCAKQIGLWLGSSFPYGTLTVNAIGSLVLGFLSGFFIEHAVNNEFRMGLTVGCLGAFTTFSTFSYESILLLQQGDFLKLGINVLSNVLICLILCLIGLQFAKYL
ncbi:MAG: fluoride efflux transporter CrcB [SAR324 cluster bacterium]|nr:fluoride efflux transporter CrcB [SAR324 cluster bacterium]